MPDEDAVPGVIDGEDGSPSVEQGAAAEAPAVDPAVAQLQQRLAAAEQFIAQQAAGAASAQAREYQSQIDRIADPAKKVAAQKLFNEWQSSVRESMLQEEARHLRVEQFANKYGADPKRLELLSRRFETTEELEELAKDLGKAAKAEAAGKQAGREPAMARARPDSGAGQGTPSRGREAVIEQIKAKARERGEAPDFIEIQQALAAAGLPRYEAQS